MHNTCEDSLLAAPIIIDLIVLCEIFERIQIKKQDEPDSSYERLHVVLSMLSYLLKAPLVPDKMPVVNALGAQRQSIVNFFRACIGLPPEDYILLENKLPSEVRKRTNSANYSQNLSKQTDEQVEKKMKENC